MKFVTLRNLSREPQVISYEGQIIRFGPLGAPDCQLDLPEAVAEIVKEHLGALVMEPQFEPQTQSFIEVKRPDSYWIANMTGDPDAPAQILTENKIDKKTGERIPIYEMNEKREPAVIRERMGRTHSYRTTESGLCQYTSPGKLLEIQPFQRIEVTRGQATTFIKRDQLRQKHQRDRVIRSRPPAEFEPKFDWKLDELRAWIVLCDPKGELVAGPSEKQVRKECEERGDSPEQTYLAIHLAHQKAFQRARLRVMNPKYRLVSQKEFETYMGKQAAKAKLAPLQAANAAKKARQSAPSQDEA